MCGYIHIRFNQEVDPPQLPVADRSYGALRTREKRGVETRSALCLWRGQMATAMILRPLESKSDYQGIELCRTAKYVIIH